MYDLEPSNYLTSPKHEEVKEVMYSNFHDTFSILCSKEIIPITMTTFVLSALIATNNILREKFYASYFGKVPAVTQFLLNCFRTNSIFMYNNHYRLFDFELDAGWHCSISSLAFGSTLFDVKYLEKNEQGFLKLIKWFQLIEKYCAKDCLFFKNFVTLQKTPMFSLDSISLGLFNYEILDFYISSIVKKNLALKGRSEIPLSGFRHRSPSGEKYLLLQQVF